jgi:ArsR family transcriptional regulator, repressor of sdpIR and other operons
MPKDEIFKALSDPTRREILRRLSRGEQTAGELAEHFATGRPTLSHHFNVLRDAGLVRSRRAGQQIYYALDTTVAEDMITWLWDLFGKKPTNETERIHEEPQ